MKFSINKAALIAAATMTFMAAPAGAQNTVDGNYVETYPTNVEQEDDDEFPWGLLGLLGLAGLLGLKKRDSDIHVDARRDTRP